jgi:hypothetical protein
MWPLFLPLMIASAVLSRTKQERDAAASAQPVVERAA